MKIFVSGMINVEASINVNSFPINYSPIEFKFFESSVSASGVGLNVAAALTSLSDEVSLFAPTGNDSLRCLIDYELSKLKIKNVHLLNILKETCTSTILYDKDGRRRIYCDLKDYQEVSFPVNDFKEALKDCRCAVICNSNFNRPLLNYAYQEKKLIATDCHVVDDVFDSYNKEFMEKSDILFISDEHIKDNYLNFLNRLIKEYDKKIIAIGRGSMGVTFYDGDKKEIFDIDAYKVDHIVNTCGAGDSLFSAFVHFYIKGNDSFLAMQKAVFFAGMKIKTSGGAKGFLNEECVNNTIK